MYKHIFAVIPLLCWLHTSFAQLSFVPDNDFYEIEQATDLTISCLYNGGVDNRVDWLEGSTVINSSLLNLSSISLGNHEFVCRFTPDTGSIQTKQLTVNVYISTRLQIVPSLSDYTYSTQLTNSTPYYLYCLGHGDPIPDLEWREDSVSIANFTADLSLPGHTFDSIKAINVKLFSSGIHQLSCFGFNGYTSAEIFLTLSADSSNLLLVYPTHNTTHNNTLFYLLTDTYTDFSINCSLKQFSLPLDTKWAGTSPVWTLFNDSNTLSNSSTVRLSNLTLGELSCVLLAADNSTIVQEVIVTFVNTQTSSTLATTNTSHSTNVTLTTEDTFNTTTGGTLRSTSVTTDPIYLSPLQIALIIAGLFTLLCISILIILTLCLVIVCGWVSKRSRERRRRKQASRILYLDIMDESYPSPPVHNDSSRYSDNTPVEGTRDISEELGVRVPIYERIEGPTIGDVVITAPAENTDNPVTNSVHNYD